MGGSSSQPAQQTTTTAPWGAQQPYLTQGFQRAENLYNSNQPQYYPGSTVAGFTPYQTQAQQMGANRAMNGSPLLQAGQNQAMSTLQGDYLNSNPYLDQVATSLDRSTRVPIDSQFGASGRYGSVGHEQARTTALASALAPYAYGSYESERGRQYNAASQAPGLAQADYADIGALSEIGSQQQQQQQAALNSDIERHNFNQNLEANKLAQYMGLISGNYGGTTMTTGTPASPGKGGADYFGGGLSAAGTAGNLGWRPFGG